MENIEDTEDANSLNILDVVGLHEYIMSTIFS